MITSSQNPLIKLLHGLRSRSGREKSGLFLLEGVRLIEAALDAQVSIRHTVYSSHLVNNQRGMACLDRIAAGSQSQPELIDDRLLCVLADTERPQGLIVAALLPQEAEQNLSGISRLLIVDGVQDPGNLGTIIRTADALGVQAMLTLAGTVDAYNEKVVRSAMGSLFHLRLQQGCEWPEILPSLRQAGLQLVVTCLQDAVPYDRAHYAEKVALIVGNEGVGVSRESLQYADLRVTIPISGQAESLNVAIATGIVLAELAKR